jgi:whirlin
MTLLIRDIGKIPYSCSYNNYPQSSSSWHAGDSSSTTHHGTSIKAVKKNCSISSIEEKARLLLSRNHFLNLIHNISEYGGRGMPVETFVTIILELLDTPEKVSWNCFYIRKHF